MGDQCSEPIEPHCRVVVESKLYQSLFTIKKAPAASADRRALRRILETVRSSHFVSWAQSDRGSPEANFQRRALEASHIFQRLEDAALSRSGTIPDESAFDAAVRNRACASRRRRTLLPESGRLREPGLRQSWLATIAAWSTHEGAFPVSGHEAFASSERPASSGFRSLL
jgi:hypothetical protein